MAPNCVISNSRERKGGGRQKLAEVRGKNQKEVTCSGAPRERRGEGGLKKGRRSSWVTMGGEGGGWPASKQNQDTERRRGKVKKTKSRRHDGETLLRRDR